MSDVFRYQLLYLSLCVKSMDRLILNCKFIIREENFLIEKLIFASVSIFKLVLLIVRLPVNIGQNKKVILNRQNNNLFKEIVWCVHLSEQYINISQSCVVFVCTCSGRTRKPRFSSQYENTVSNCFRCLNIYFT